MKTNSHPIQPFVTDKSGTLRFKENRIVSDLLDLGAKHGLGLNEIALKDYTDEDRRQFAQLIGYSLSGYSELRSYVDDAAYAAAVEKSKNSKKTDAEIERDHCKAELKALRKSLQKPMARLFEVHPDDLHT